MILSARRGWGPDEFRLVSPMFAEAVRFAVFAEKAAPLLGDLEGVQNIPMKHGMAGEDRLALARAKRDAAKALPAIREALYPEDEPLG